MFSFKCQDGVYLGLTKKVYFNNKKHRIVYETIEDKIMIYIVAVGKREKMDVYKKADSRVN